MGLFQESPIGFRTVLLLAARFTGLDSSELASVQDSLTGLCFRKVQLASDSGKSNWPLIQDSPNGLWFRKVQLASVSGKSNWPLIQESPTELWFRTVKLACFRKVQLASDSRKSNWPLFQDSPTGLCFSTVHILQWPCLGQARRYFMDLKRKEMREKKYSNNKNNPKKNHFGWKRLQVF